MQDFISQNIFNESLHWRIFDPHLLIIHNISTMKKQNETFMYDKKICSSSTVDFLQ